MAIPAFNLQYFNLIEIYDFRFIDLEFFFSDFLENVNKYLCFTFEVS
jgi:hypothetical protein